MRLRPGFLAAVVLLAGLGAWVYWFEFRDVARRTAADEAKQRPVHFERDALESIHLRDGDRSIRLERRDGDWAIAEPLATAADREAVEALITTLDTARIERRIGPAADLPGYSLDPPAATVTLETSGAAPQTLAIGERNPVGGAYFAMLPDGEVALVSATLGDLARKDLLALRDKSLLAFDPWKITRVRLERGDETIVVEKPDEGWTLREPIEGPADGPAMTDLLTSLERLRVASFVSETPASADLTRYGLEPPAVRVVVYQPDWDAERTVLFGAGTGDARYARTVGRDPIVTVPNDIWSKVTTPVFDLRRKDLLGFNQYRVRGITAARGGEEALVLARQEDGAWAASGAAEGTVGDETVDAFLRAVSDLKAVGFEDRPSRATREALSNRPSFDLTLEEESGGEEAVPRAQHLLLGALDRAGRVRVLDPEWGPVALVEKEIAGRVAEQWGAVVEEVTAGPATPTPEDGAGEDPAAPPAGQD